MRNKIAGALGLAGFLTIAGATGGLEWGGSVINYLLITAAGVVMIAVAMLLYECQCVQEERRRNSLKHRRMQYEDGLKRRSDSY